MEAGVRDCTMESINDNLEGIYHKGKRREIVTQRLFEQQYPDELSKMKALNPIDRSSLISHVLSELDDLGATEGAITSSCNSVLDSIGLSGLDTSSYSFLKANGTLNDIALDMGIIIGLNHLLKRFNGTEHYSAYHHIRNADAFAVSTPSTKLSTNEVEAIQKNRTMKLRETVRDNFFRKFDTLFPIFKNLVLNEDALLEHFENNQQLFTKGKAYYHEYLSLNNMYEQHIYNSDYSTLLKPHQPVAQSDYDKALKSLRDGQSLNIPDELKEIVIMSILK